MTLHKMGEEAVIDLAAFSLDGPERKTLRAAHARALRDGLTLELALPPHDPALLASLKALSDGWLAARETREKGFSVGRCDPAWLDRWLLALVRHEGRVVAFANVLASQRSASIDLVRQDDATPPGTMDFLFTALILALRDHGFATLSLGMAPLSGLDPERSRRLWDRFGSLIYQHGGGFHTFAGLRAFKAGFLPDWRPRYLATSTAIPPLMPLADAARLIAQRAPGDERRTAGKKGRRGNRHAS